MWSTLIAIHKGLFTPGKFFPTLDSVQINPSTVSVITTTYYPNATDPIQQVRAALAEETIRALGFAGFPVTVIDGGSDESIFPIHELGARVMVVDDNDMVFTRQLAAASVVDRNPYLTHMVWLEPEKNLADDLPSWVERAIEESAAVLIPMRKSMEGYPLHQQLSERLLNEQLAEVFGRELGDQVFGPRIFRRDAVIKHWLRDFEDYNSEARQWSAITAPVWSALAAGDRVVGLPVDFTYPQTQTLAETDNDVMLAKRRLQRDVITQNAIDVRDTLPQSEWDFEILDGFTLQSQPMAVIDLTEVSEEAAAS